MIDCIYIEEEVRDHPRTQQIVERFPRAIQVPCDRYSELFNLRAQNFRLQKQRPALILAKKHGQLVLPAPPEYQIGADLNFYFSHMLNCLYDCRYCFLQGMYQSANYVLFVNYDDFARQISSVVDKESPDGGNLPRKKICFFSGYDCDSLALDSVTGFAGYFLDHFSELPGESWLELRTKSIQTSALSDRSPMANVIVSFTLTPDEIAKEVEHGAPPLGKRLDRVQSLTRQGWVVGLRFDPLIPWPGYEDIYRRFFESVFSLVEEKSVHSATLGPMRFPSKMYDRIVKLYPDDPLFARFDLEKRQGMASYPEELEKELVGFVQGQLNQFLPPEKIFNHVN